MKTGRTHEMGTRMLTTLIILAVYIIGRNILIFGADAAAYEQTMPGTYNLIVSMISGDRYRCTVFALGIMPYISASLTMMVYMAIRGSDYKSRMSQQRIERYTFILMIPFALMSALSYSSDLVFRSMSMGDNALRAIAVIEMMAGAVIIFKLAGYNKEHGIGGQSAIILINVIDNFIVSAGGISWADSGKLIILCIVMTIVILVIEMVPVKIPVQRVSIHNIYADKNYIGFKLNPIGVMPVMFATAFFMLPQFLVEFLLYLNSESTALQNAYDSLKLTDMTGVIVYLLIIFTLDVVFSFVMLSPGEIADRLQKNGDSIAGVYAGKKTKQYLRKTVLALSCISGLLLCLMMGTSLMWSLAGDIFTDAALFPATVMILIGLICPICQEIKTYIQFDSYSFFI